MVMSRDQNAEENNNIQIGNKSFETMEQFKYLGTILRMKFSLMKKLRADSTSGNACYYSVQNIFRTSLLPKSVKIKIYIEL
jgi:hypothetical protein